MANSYEYEFKKEDAERFASLVHAQVQIRGNEMQFKRCPYCGGGQHHDEKTFSINLTTGQFNCLRGSCGASGNMITLLQDFEGFTLGNSSLDDYYLKRERKYRTYPSTYKIEVKDPAIKYLEKRGIPETITRQYEITVRKDNDSVLVFPFKDETNEICFVKYRNLDYVKGESKKSKEWCQKNCKPILFGMNHCNFENHTLVITEGQIDSLSCAAAGIENAVSVPTGKNGFTWVPHCFNFLGRFDELIVFGDYEDGEISLLTKMGATFHGRIKHVRPEDYKDCKDANEILQKYGVDAIRDCINNAVDLPVKGLKKLKDIQRISLKDKEVFKTDIEELDKKCTFYFGELIILTGAAGEGKSTLASQWATMAMSQNYSTMIYSGEMQSWLVKDWLDFQIAGKHNLNNRNDITEETYKLMVDSPMYERLYLYDLDDIENNQDRFLKIMIEGIQQYGIRFIVIDNLMTVMDYNDNLELNDAQTAYTKKLAKIAQDHDVIIVLIVHPRKSKAGMFSNDDVAGSSNIINRAHKVIRYARPTKEFTDMDGKKWTKEELYDCGIRELTVLKDRLTGKTISQGILLYFEEATKRIATNKQFNWHLSWENINDGFRPAEDHDEIPF